MLKQVSFFASFIFLASVSFAEQTSKILATSALSTIEGAAGGGIVPWAVIGGYGSEGEWGAAASAGGVQVTDL
ncbi:MAG: hypothetical protein ACI9DO_001684, partial [Reinekea sp.]